MSSESPAAELYSSDGFELSAQNATSIPVGTRGLLSMGSDGTNSRFIKVDASGNVIVVGAGVAGTPAGGVITIQGVTSGTAVTVAGTVTGNQGTANTTANAWPIKVTDGTNTSAVKAASTAAVATDPALVVTFSPNTALPTGANVIGAVTQSGGPWTGNITQFGSVNISTGTGASGTGIPRVTVSNDSNILATQSGTWTVQPGNTANTTPWLTTINNGGNSAAVKAASTAAVATDPALVVAISPNNSLGLTTNDSTATGTLGALNATVQLAVAGSRNSGMQLVAGTLVGTIIPEISMDGGTTWVSTFFDDPITGNITTSVVFGSSNTATTKTIAGAGGSSHVRIRVSAYTSGTATCNLRASTILDPTTLYGGAAGSALPPIISQAGGSVTTSAPSYTTGTLNALSLTTVGNLRVDGSSVTQPVSGTVAVTQSTSPWVNNITQFGGTNVSTGTGAGGAGIPRVTVSNDSNILATQSGTWTVQPGNTANTTPWLVTDSADGPVAPGTVAGKSMLIGGQFNTALPVLTNTQQSAIQLDSSGRIIISSIPTGANVIGAVTQSGGPWTGNITQFGSNNVVTGTGASGVGIPRVTVSNDSNVLATQSGTWTVQPGNTANTTPWLTTINNGGNSAAVKAASTAAVATDPALVVAISPNNALGITTNDVTGSGTLNALNATAQVTMAGLSSAGIQLSAGTLIGTIVPEISMDGGTTWDISFFDDPTTSNIVGSIVFASSNTAITRTIVGSGGASHARVRVSAFTSGTASCTIRASQMYDPSELFGGAAGSALPPVINQSGGSVTTSAPAYTTATLNALSLNTTGDLRVIGKVTDGTNTAAVKAASTAPVAADPALVVTLSPNSAHIQGTIKPLYGTNNQSMTITMASLASAAARASTAVDNTTNLYEDVHIFFKMATNTAGVSATGYINIYAYGTVDGGTTYPEAITGTDAAITLTTPPNLVLIAQLNANAVSKTYTFGPVSFCRMYGLDKLPAKWGVVVVNQTGAAFTATAGNYAVTYQGINGQLV